MMEISWLRMVKKGEMVVRWCLMVRMTMIHDGQRLTMMKLYQQACYLSPEHLQCLDVPCIQRWCAGFLILDLCAVRPAPAPAPNSNAERTNMLYESRVNINKPLTLWITSDRIFMAVYLGCCSPLTQNHHRFTSPSSWQRRRSGFGVSFWYTLWLWSQALRFGNFSSWLTRVCH